MKKAFVLGAGLGTRLRPLTQVRPKPLIPVVNRPLITYAFDLLRTAGVESFIVNTHHLPEAYDAVFGDGTYEGCPISFVHEHPEILETGGGIANIADRVRNESFWVFNGDILTDLPLAAAATRHRESGNLVTLILRSAGSNPNVTFDPESGQVLDLRQALGTDPERFFQFTGIYLVHPGFLDHLPAGKGSVVPAFLDVITGGTGRIGGIVLDEGDWWDLGDRDSYLAATRAWLEKGTFLERDLASGRIAGSARIDATARIDDFSVVGDGVEIGPGARIEESILWPGSVVMAGARLTRCIVTGRAPAEGGHEGADL